MTRISTDEIKWNKSIRENLRVPCHPCAIPFLMTILGLILSKRFFKHFQLFPNYRIICKMKKIPGEFESFLWSYRLSAMDAEKHKQRIIINVINYGKWKHWKKLYKFYGRKELKRVIETTSATEFRPPALKLISLLLGIKDFKYASRNIKR